MERALSQDERIRRAEELYARRKMIEQSRTSATVNVDEKSSNRITKKLIFQFVMCLIIYITFYAIKNIPNFVPQEVMYKISDVLEYDINIQELYNKMHSFTNNKFQGNNQEDVTNILKEETLSVTDNQNASQEGTDENNTAQNNISDTQSETTEVETQTEETSSLSQMEIDAEYVKCNLSIIKPLEGEITSRFGVRNPTVPTVPKYHTGIDIARVTGTVIIAAMDGDVELVSDVGDYGNHVKITNGEVTTLYAHCSKIYVQQGEHITQGTPIAEVGATGNVTGPHLHFEIRRNNNYIDPDLILQF